MTRPPKHPIAPLPPQATAFDRALAAYQQGRRAEAEQLYAQVPPSDNRYALALHDRGWIKHQAGDHAGALELVQESLRLQPGILPWIINLADILLSSSQPEESIATCDHALALNPKSAHAWNTKGRALLKLMQHESALECLNQALLLAPHVASIWANRGLVLGAMQKFDGAIKSWGYALRLAPNNIGMWMDYGDLFIKKRQPEEALACFKKVLALDPSHQKAATLAMFCAHHVVQWNDIKQHWQHELELIRTSDAAVIGFGALSNPYMSAHDQVDSLRQTMLSNFRDIMPAPFPKRAPSRRLHIAYLSADFGQHPMTFLMAGVFEHHDREQFEVTAVAFKPISPSLLGQRLVSAFEQVLDVHDKTDDQVAVLLRERNIDIAIDLMGHTVANRLGIFARRCAPIQVNYLGYPGTSGAPFIDYIIGDRWVSPLNQADTFSEKIVLMPESFQANDEKRQIAPETPSRASLDLPESGFVFCCLNNTYKITPMVFDIWMRLLIQVPGSVLWLLAATKTAETNLRAEAQARGVDSNRLVFTKYVPYEQYLAQYRQADLFLDTLPFNAGTTASDALWAGLPVLTQLGQTFAGRMAASLLDAVGLPELIARSEQEYEQLALKLATEPGLLKSYRNQLAANLPTAPLFDTTRFTRHLETAYQMMWQRHEQGLAPDHIAVPALPARTKAVASAA